MVTQSRCDDDNLLGRGGSGCIENEQCICWTSRERSATFQTREKWDKIKGYSLLFRTTVNSNLGSDTDAPVRFASAPKTAVSSEVVMAAMRGASKSVRSSTGLA